MKQVIDSLPPKSKEIIMLYKISRGQVIKKIAARWGIFCKNCGISNENSVTKIREAF